MGSGGRRGLEGRGRGVVRGGGKERGKERARGETGRGKLSAGEGKRRKEEVYG